MAAVGDGRGCEQPMRAIATGRERGTCTGVLRLAPVGPRVRQQEHRARLSGLYGARLYCTRREPGEPARLHRPPGSPHPTLLPAQFGPRWCSPALPPGCCCTLHAHMLPLPSTCCSYYPAPPFPASWLAQFEHQHEQLAVSGLTGALEGALPATGGGKGQAVGKPSTTTQARLPHLPPAAAQPGSIKPW